MRKLKKLSMNNYRCVKSADLIVGEGGLISITGKNMDDSLSPSNGAGKSTLKSALTFNLFGKTETGRGADAILCWWNPTDCSVISEWESDGNIIKIARYRKHRDFDNDVKIYFNGADVSGKDNTDTQKIIDDFLGFNYALFCILLTTGSMSKNMLPFALMGDKERKEFISNILDLGYIETARGKVSEQLSDKMDEATTLEHDIIRINAKLDTIAEQIVSFEEKIIEDSENAVKSLVKKRRELDECKTKLDSLLREKATSELKMKRLATQKQEIDYNELDALHLSSGKLNVQMIDLDNEKAQIKSEMETAACIEGYSYLSRAEALPHTFSGEIVKIAEDTKDKFNALEKEITGYKNFTYLKPDYPEQDTLDKKEEEAKVIKAEYSVVKNQIAEVQDVQNLGVECPTCGQEIDGERLESSIAQLKSKKQGIKDKAMALSQELQSLREKREAWYENDRQTAQSAAILKSEELEAELVKLAKTFTTVLSEYIAEFLKNRKEKLSALNVKTNKIGQELMDIEESVQSFRRRVSAVEAHNARVEKEREQAQMQINGFERDIAFAEGDIKTLDVAIKELANYVSPYVDGLDRAKMDVGRQKTLLSGKVKKQEVIQKEVATLKFWAEAFGPKGLQSYILDTVLSLLDSKANYCLSHLVDSDLLIGFNTQAALRSGAVRDKFTVELHRDGHQIDFLDLSRGESVKVSFAINYALKALAKHYNNIELNFDWYDEVLDGLDEIGCYQLISFLRQETKEVQNIFVISHNDNLKNMFDTQIVMEKHNGVSTLKID